VHDNAQRGVVAQNDIDATSIWMRDTLVALNHEVAIFSSGSTVTIDTSVVHTTQPNAQGIGGRGLSVQAADTVPSTLLVRSSVLDRNHDVAVFAAGSEATLEASVVRATQPTRETSSGRGVAVQSSSATRAPSALSIGTSVIEQNHGVGVYVEGSEATVDASVVRTTEPDAHGVGGVGLAVQADSTTGAPSTLIFKSSLVDDNREQGVIIVGSDVTIEGAMIRRTRLNTQGEFGRGASVQASSSLLLRTSVIEQSYNSGLFVVGSEATVEASVVRLVEPNAGVRGYGVHAQREGAASKLTMRASLIEQTRTGVLLDSSEAHVETSVIRATDLDGQGFFGRGVQVQSDMLGPSTLVIDRSAIEKSHEAAVFVIDSVATIDSCRLAESVPNAFDALGDGVVVMAAEDSASTSIIATRVDRAALAAVATWGAYVSVSGSAFTCQAIDVATETYLGRAATLEDLGGNLCGCPDATESCKALSANLQPPTALEPD
jgi:hypothetical protein